MHVEESTSLLGVPLWEWGVLVSAKPSSADGQHSIHFLGCLNTCLILKVHNLTQKLFTSLSLTPICGPLNGTFQQGSNCLMVMMDGDPNQSISCPFWYSKVNSKEANTPTHLCSVASRLGVVKTYVSRLLSVCTTNDTYVRYSLKCSVILLLRARNSSLELW